MSYVDHYGLAAAPFALTPDPRFWYESATHKKAMAYLGYGLAQAEGFVVVTGEVGAGKTTLVGLLMERLDAARYAVVKLVSTQVEGDDMLRLAAQAFGVQTDGVAKAQLLDRVERYLVDRAREGRKTLLIVDEAQTIGVSALEELRMLSNFQSGGRALLQILLLGQPEFRERLASPALEQLRQRVIATHHLEGMTVGETRAYLEHRLKIVGWDGRPRFDDAACAALHAASGGIPRRMNQLATRALLLAAVEDSDSVDGDLVAHVVADQRGEPVAVPPPPPVAVPVAVAEPVVEFPVESVVREDELASVVEAAVPEVTPARVADTSALEARLAALEAQAVENDAALRRVLTLLIDWVERDESRADDARRARAI